ncbi:MAG: hypothetical protein ACJAYE_001402 [Candidatus Azotimanducaceae bacterium]|jgi:hypothetical protein
MSEVFCEAPFNYINDAAVSDADRTLAVQKQVRNGRTADLPGWQECGFELKEHQSSVTDWDSEQAIVEQHYAEIRELAQALTGCDFALVDGHIKRGPEQLKIHADYGPISFVHSDFAASYGDLLRQHYAAGTPDSQLSLSKSGATLEDVKQCGRLMILQFWRNIGEQKMDLPLAFCDARSVTEQDLRAFPVQDYGGGGFDFETLGIASSDRHAWFTFPEMNRDEVAVFRTYDSNRIGSQKPYWTPHSAFQDPEVTQGQPSRKSIELRATCLFKS